MVRALLHLLLVFVCRHWILAVLNTLLTWWLCLTVLYLARHWLPVRTQARWKQTVLVWTLAKGSFYLLLGDNRPLRHHSHYISGLQLPDPVELLRLWPQTRFSIWQPTPAMHLVTLLSMACALSLLAWRARQVSRSYRTLNVFRQLHSPPELPLPTALTQPAALTRAAAALRIPSDASLPVVVVAQSDYPTPLLLGGLKPILVLSPELLKALSEAEMEMALRHELAHWLRRDHLSRWLLLWVSDVSFINPVSLHLRTQAIQQEELLCDAMAVGSRRDALLMAQALQKALRVSPMSPPGLAKPELAEMKMPFPKPAPDGSPASDQSSVPGQQAFSPRLPDFVVPSLFGITRRDAFSLLAERLANLLQLAQQVGQKDTGSAADSTANAWLRLRLISRSLTVRLALGIIVYMKFYLVIG